MKEVRFALVGCGHVARKHVDAILATKHASLVAVCDLKIERALALSEELRVPAFVHLDDMIANVPDIEVVNVLTPSGDHSRHTIAIAAHGKHVVVEKPMALTVADADEMLVACEQARVELFVAKQCRYNAAVLKLRDAINMGRFGKTVMGTARVRRCRPQSYYDSEPWRGTVKLDGGVLANQASHHLDLLIWMLGPVESVCAMAERRLADVEVADTAAVLLRFSSGALGVVEVTTATRPADLESSLSILGEGGTVVIAGRAIDEVTTWSFASQQPADATALQDIGALPGHRALIENVVATLRAGARPTVDGREARKSVEVIEAVRESVETRREVALRDLKRESYLRSRNRAESR